MEIYQLNSFIAIAETGKLTSAAKVMNISQAAMSSQIKALEEELGVMLFMREARGMVLTDSGSELLKEAKKVVMASHKMKQRSIDLQNMLSGELNIGINTDPRFLEISDISKRVINSMPGVKLSFIESQTFETCKKLLDGEIDVGFHFGPIENGFLHSVQLLLVPICAVLPINMAQGNGDAPLEKIASLPWVWTKYGCPFHVALRKELEKRSLQLNQVTDAVEENIVRELVKAGTGAALMRKDEALDLVSHGEAIIWSGFELEIPLGIACLEKRKTERVISTFFKIIKEKYNG